jgi:hypothetical protein
MTTDKNKLAAKAVKLFPALKAGELKLADVAEKVTGAPRFTKMNFTRSLLVNNCDAAKRFFATSAKRYKKAAK